MSDRAAGDRAPAQAAAQARAGAPARDLALVALFAAITAVCAQVSLVLPFLSAVPFTLQVFAVLASGAALGARRGALSQVVYLLLGASGLPVFARFHGGAAVLAGPTAGYLWAYPLAAALAGWGWGWGARVPGAGPGVRGAGLAGWLGLAAGLGCIYALGVAGLVATRTVPDAARALRAGVYPFVLFDAAKAALAGVVAQRVRAAVPALESPESSGGGDER